MSEEEGNYQVRESAERTAIPPFVAPTGYIPSALQPSQSSGAAGIMGLLSRTTAAQLTDNEQEGTNAMYQHLDSAIKPFIGKNLKSISRLKDDEVLVEFEDGAKVKVSVAGDCCSHSIFYEIEMPEELRGATLEDVSASGYPEDSESVKTADEESVALEKVKASGIEFSPEENRVWNVVLKTNRGNALIRHINSSNGYYDGDVYFEPQDGTQN